MKKFVGIYLACFVVLFVLQFTLLQYISTPDNYYTNSYFFNVAMWSLSFALPLHRKQLDRFVQQLRHSNQQLSSVLSDVNASNPSLGEELQILMTTLPDAVNQQTNQADAITAARRSIDWIYHCWVNYTILMLVAVITNVLPTPYRFPLSISFIFFQVPWLIWVILIVKCSKVLTDAQKRLRLSHRQMDALLAHLESRDPALHQQVKQSMQAIELAPVSR